ncbi:hypothetical protein PQO03_21940 [Lentisphaera profundi]|uniref:Glycosyl hydrolase family 43 n=1 Tax=Lentisphaera profundi TaxID=1658616 RepID=A0ABY7VX34_9BACT|nr:hypothetical protein [Lentisphaera profundi]WDE98476.1 hypothetical protein PQO03_21940 [Lentisphaera profundi]
MKKSLFYSLIFTAALNLFGAEPIIKHIYTADPSAHVFDGKLYLYPSHDPDKLEGFFPMVDYHAFSSSDLKSWQVLTGELDGRGLKGIYTCCYLF